VSLVLDAVDVEADAVRAVGAAAWRRFRTVVPRWLLRF
jgi:hypothetical protein